MVHMMSTHFELYNASPCQASTTLWKLENKMSWHTDESENLMALSSGVDVLLRLHLIGHDLNINIKAFLNLQGYCHVLSAA